MADDGTDRTRRFYDTVASLYAEMIPDTRYESALDLAIVDDFVRLLGDRPAEVLDAGCGTGRMVTHLRSLNQDLRTTGLDLSAGMLAVAREEHPGNEFVEGSLADLPFDDDAFDGVLAWYSIIHTAPGDLGGACAEVHRVLRAGGLALFGFQAGTGERTSDGAYGHDVELHAYLHDAASVSTRLEKSGLMVDTVLERGPRAWERLPQAFVLARKPGR